jgi:hypothetical protein
VQDEGFYLVIAASTLIGLCINFTNVNPIKALGIVAALVLLAV